MTIEPSGKGESRLRDRRRRSRTASDAPLGEVHVVTSAHPARTKRALRPVSMSAPGRSTSRSSFPASTRPTFSPRRSRACLAQTLPPARDRSSSTTAPSDNTDEVAGRYRAACADAPAQPRRRGRAQRGPGARRAASSCVFLDADDRLLPDAVEVGVAALSSVPQVAFVSGDCRDIGDDGAVLPGDAGSRWSPRTTTCGCCEDCFIWSGSSVRLPTLGARGGRRLRRGSHRRRRLRPLPAARAAFPGLLPRAGGHRVPPSRRQHHPRSGRRPRLVAAGPARQRRTSRPPRARRAARRRRQARRTHDGTRSTAGACRAGSRADWRARCRRCARWRDVARGLIGSPSVRRGAQGRRLTGGARHERAATPSSASSCGPTTTSRFIAQAIESVLIQRAALSLRAGDRRGLLDRRHPGDRRGLRASATRS